MNIESKNPIPSLDGWRAIAILLVFIAHIGFGNIIPGGFGVTIFFFLSGYLITTLIIEEYKKTGKFSISNFYIRRAFRLLPPLIITLAFSYSFVLLGIISGGASWKGFLAQLLYFSNYYSLFFDPGNTTPAGSGILWSLAIEEHFYFMYPLLVLLSFTITNSKKLLGILITVCILILVWRIYLTYSPGFYPERTYYASDTRMDSIIFGCIFALVKNPVGNISENGVLQKKHLIIIACSLILIFFSLVYRDIHFRESYRYTIQGIALAPLFYFSIKFPGSIPFNFLNKPVVMRIGVYSYSIYLIHYILINFIEKYTSSILLIGLLSGILSILYSMAMDNIVDSYFRKLRRKFSSKKGN